MKVTQSINSLLLLSLLLPGVSSAEDEEAEVTTQVAVQVAAVSRATLHAYLDSYGYVAPEPAAAGRPAGAAYLTAPVAGLVLDVPVSEGEQIHKGDLVVRLDDRLAKADVERAEAQVRYANQALTRTSRLLKQRNASQKQYEAAQQEVAVAKANLATAQGVLAQVQLRSSLDGIVSRINVLPGQAVDLNTVLAEIVDLHRLVVTVNIPTAAIERVKPGQSAQVIAAGQAEPIQAQVAFISSSVDPKTGSVRVRLTLPADSRLRPGQFVKVRIAVEEHAQSLVVPEASVYTSIDGVSTLSVVEDNVAKKRQVELGLRETPWIEVRAEGLEAGMTVVTVGSYGLPEETQIVAVNSQGR